MQILSKRYDEKVKKIVFNHIDSFEKFNEIYEILDSQIKYCARRNRTC